MNSADIERRADMPLAPGPDIASEVRAYIVDTFLFGDPGNLDAESSLLDAGALDSTGVIELVAFLEERYGITIDDSELLPENLDSIGRIARFVGRRLSADAGGP